MTPCYIVYSWHGHREILGPSDGSLLHFDIVSQQPPYHSPATFYIGHEPSKNVRRGHTNSPSGDSLPHTT